MRLVGKRATPHRAPMPTPLLPAARWTAGRIAFSAAMALAVLLGLHWVWDRCTQVKAPGLLLGTTVFVEPKSVARVRKVDVAENQPVRKDDPLVWLDDVELGQQWDRQNETVNLFVARLETERLGVRADTANEQSRIDSELGRLSLDLGSLETQNGVATAKAVGARRQLAAIQQRVVEQEDLVALGTLPRSELSRSQLDLGAAASDLHAFELESAGVQASIASAQKRRVELVARRDAVGSQIEAASRVETLTTELTAAREELQRIASRRDELVLRAPVSGIVQKLSKRPGEIALAGDPILEIADPSAVMVEANFEQIDQHRCVIGAAVDITFETGLRRRGRIAELKPVAEPLPIEYRNQFEARRTTIVAVIRPADDQPWPNRLMLHAVVRSSRFGEPNLIAAPETSRPTSTARRELPMGAVRR